MWWLGVPEVTGVGRAREQPRDTEEEHCLCHAVWPT